MTKQPRELTARQLEVLETYASHACNMSAAARALGISSWTVKKTLDAVAVKLGVQLEEHYGSIPFSYSVIGTQWTREETVQRARELGLIPPESQSARPAES